jgi:hypothetical protein
MRIRLIDAFTDAPFGGNPAGVCLLDDPTWPDHGWMRQVADELGHETAFVHPLPGDTGADWAVRWFTSAAESNVCGHATLAAAHALYTDRATPVTGSLTIRFASGVGVLTAHIRRDGAITLDFPAAPCTETPMPAGLAEALGTRLAATYRTGAWATCSPWSATRLPSAPSAPISPRWPAWPDETTSADSSPPPRQSTRTAATTSSPATSPPPTASPRTWSPVARTRPGPVLVAPPRARQAHRPASLGPPRPGWHRRARRPGPPHRPCRHRSRRHPAPPAPNARAASESARRLVLRTLNGHG